MLKLVKVVAVSSRVKLEGDKVIFDGFQALQTMTQLMQDALTVKARAKQPCLNMPVICITLVFQVFELQ